MFRNLLLTIFAAVLVMSGCSHTMTAAQTADTDTAADLPEETVVFNGITKKKSELTEDTLKWLDWYQSLPEDQQRALNFIPSEFSSGLPSAELYAALETNQDGQSYVSALSEQELEETAELARYYFTELSPEFEGVEQLMPADDTSPLYQNAGIEKEYTPGNIIIYLVETVKDKEEGNPMRSISIARRSKSDEWKVINSGY